MGRLRDLPSVDRVLADARLAAAPHSLAVAAVRAALEHARSEIREGRDPGDVVALALAELADARRPNLRRVVNATGVIVHTNLGRAPLSADAIERVVDIAGGYSTLEYDVEAGARGSR
jgi:L-seryl-tRNA(Ser) seleniumtransferase